MRARLAVILVAACLVAGCGDDAGSADDTTTTAPTDDGSTVDAAADLQAAEEAVLTLSDMPAGFVPSEDDTSDESNLEFQALMADCFGVDVSVIEEDGDPEAESAFESADDLPVSIDSSVEVNPNTEDGAEQMALIASQEAARCFEEAFSAAFEKEVGSSDVAVGDVSVKSVPLESVGDDAAGFRVTAPLASAGQSIVVTVDLHTVIVGRATVDTSFTTFDSEGFDPDEAFRLTELVVSRVPSDL